MNARLAVRTDETMLVMRGANPGEEKAWIPSENSCWRTSGQSRRAYFVLKELYSFSGEG
jgi:hypothetical protein